ncbi:MAG: DNA polymerase III subunit gamma/tau [Desulfobacteraceae bacterium]|jgi:DNA polymerase-3 subunit gamma/tau|nr:MAG: DNA polymerase III subunit gamma/tau [Desulfobacteraceae bacterium]
MAYEVIARKWRPQVFQDVIGQEHVTQTLINAMKTDRLAHAYLFGGPRGVGKTSVARIFAKAINCTEGEPGTPCNRCRSCIEITEGSSVDVQEIDGASNRGIDEIRELRENIRYLPSSSRYRVYIIDEVHMLTLPAFNALLKTLEEPPAHVKFVFATTESHKVPITILSRCQRFDFKRIPLSQLAEHLKTITCNEGVIIGESALRLIARAAEGSMRDAQSLLDQVISFTGTTVEESRVREILGIIDRDILLNVSRAVIENDVVRCVEMVEELYTSGHDLKDFYRSLMHQLRNLIFCLIVPNFRPQDFTESELDDLRQQAKKAGETKLQTALDFLIHREESIRQTSYPRLILEATLIKLCRMGEFLSVKDILLKIAQIEKALMNAPAESSPKQIQEDPPLIGFHDAGYSERDIREDSIPEVEINWAGFMKFLSGKNRLLCSMLNGAAFKGFDNQCIQLEVAPGSFSTEYLGAPEKLEQISAYTKDFFGKKLKIELKKAPSNPASNNLKTTPEQDKPTEKRDLASSPAVQGVIAMFEGEIMRESANKKEEH